MARPEAALPFEVRRLDPDDDRGGFRSGNVDLDRFFWRLVDGLVVAPTCLTAPRPAA